MSLTLFHFSRFHAGNFRPPELVRMIESLESRLTVTQAKGGFILLFGMKVFRLFGLLETNHFAVWFVFHRSSVHDTVAWFQLTEVRFSNPVVE